MKKLLTFLTVLILVPTLCGCFDNQEIDKTAYVIAVGIDKGKDIYNYTFQISSPLAMSSGGEVSAPEGGEENTRVQNIVIGAPDLYDARNKLNNFLSKDVNLSHLKLIALSMDTAEEGLSPHMTFLLREREVRPNTRLCITQGKAEDFLKGINPALEANTAEYYDSVAENGSIYAPPKTLREFVNEDSLFASAIPLGITSEAKESDDFQGENENSLRISSSKSEFSGLCLLKDRKAVGTISPKLGGLFGLLTGETEEMDISIKKGEKWHMVRLRPEKQASFTVNQADQSTTVNMYISFDAETNGSENALTAREIENHLSKEAYALFLDAQKAGCDIFGAGNYLKRGCKTISEWESLNWDKKFETAFFMPHISVSIKLENSGTM